ncbi:MAG: SCO family protein [Kofleriaceae bacterium]
MATEAATPSAGMSGRVLLLAMLGVLLLAVGAIAVFAFVLRDAEPELDHLGKVPAFTLVDESGQRFTEEALRGHPTIVSFVFTRCDSICPTLSGRAQRLQEKTADRKGVAIKLISFSVDPTYDTPVRLAEYAKRFSADPTRWRFLTGPPDKVTALVTGPFMTLMDREGITASGAPSIVHSGYFILVDADLEIRGVYDSNDEQRLDEMIHHARYLARISDDRSYKFGGT